MAAVGNRGVEEGTPSRGRWGWIVGIDVGGTFTDAVAVAPDGRMLTAKVPSTPRRPEEAVLAALRLLTGMGPTTEVGPAAPDASGAGSRSWGAGPRGSGAGLGGAGAESGGAGAESGGAGNGHHGSFGHDADPILPGEILRVVHGTTVGTNALLTGALPRVVLCATDGFTDLLTIRTGQRPSLYDLCQPRPPELVAPADRIAVRERLAADGRPVIPLEAEEIRRVVERVARRRPASVAVAFLFAFRNPAHEAALADALRVALPGIPVTVSSAVAPEVREYPRTVTTVVAAGLRPVLEGYLARATAGLAELGVTAPLLVMESGGGIVSAERAGREPHRLVLSGPAGGVAGALDLAGRLGLRDFIALDMGGTSVDVALVRDGTLPLLPVQEVAGLPLLVPALDIVTAGAGGGSIAWLDPAGGLQVGPRSAGADPGPAAYGRGGREATVTDAHLVVGTLGESTRLAGQLTLDGGAARRAVGAVGRRLGLATGEAAAGILRLATAQLAAAVRRVSVERGIDPRGLPLVAYGGAGPLHAAWLMAELGLGEAIIPPAPGLLCAAGLVAADVRLDAAQTVLVTLTPARRERAGDADRAVAEMAAWYRRAGRALVAQLADEGIPRSAVRLVASADLRYLGQGFELTIPLAAPTRAGIRGLPAAFHAAHQTRYGHADPTQPVEVVTLRLRAVGHLERPRPAPAPLGRRRPPMAARRGERRVVLPEGEVGAPVWWRPDLEPGVRLVGPAIVEQLDATTWVPPGTAAWVGPWGELRLRRR
jgi:N-methylhydantoinase A